LRCFKDFVPLRIANSEGIPGCGRASWAFSEEIFFFVPFYPCFASVHWHEKGTKIRKWQENAQMAERKDRKTEVFLPCRGTNIEKTSKNARDSLQETVLCLFLLHRSSAFFVLDISGKSDIFILSVFT